MPIDHYDKFVLTPAARGARGGLHVGYKALGGSYLHEQPFVDLVRSGYLGTYSDTTHNLKVLIDGIISRGRAVVAAIQSKSSVMEAEMESEDE